MPGLDRKGPQGQGSRTGRGLGKCNPDNRKSNEQLDADEFQGGMGRRSGPGMRRGPGKKGGKRYGRRSGRDNS